MSKTPMFPNKFAIFASILGANLNKVSNVNWDTFEVQRTGDSTETPSIKLSNSSIAIGHLYGSVTTGKLHWVNNIAQNEPDLEVTTQGYLNSYSDLSSLASALGVNGVMETLVNHTGNSAYTFRGNTRYVYILEDNFRNLYRAYFIVSSDNIVVICNGFPSDFSFNNETPKRVHVSQTNSGGVITVAITVSQETSYNLYALKLII